jgi:hypothetical protein
VPADFIVNCTFAEHASGTLSKGVGQMTLKNTILANSPLAVSSGITDGGYNVCSDSSANFTHPFSLNNTDPALGPLTNNGGPTLTMLPQPASPAIDGGSDSGCPIADQRGVVRRSERSATSARSRPPWRAPALASSK